MISSILWLLLMAVATVNCRYVFIPEDEEMFTPCDWAPERDINHLSDLSDIIFKYKDNAIHLAGNATVIWDVKPTDRIELNIEVYKYVRGSWMPTVLSIRRNDLCRTLFSPAEFWYVWSRHIPDEDRICFNHKGIVYHHEAFDFSVEVNVLPPSISEGRYKMEFFTQAHDDEKGEQTNYACVNLIGDLVAITTGI